MRTPTHTQTHILQNKLKQPQYKVHTKWNSHSTIKYPQYKFTLMCMVLCPQELQHNSLHFKTKSLDINHFTSLHLFTLNSHDAKSLPGTRYFICLSTFLWNKTVPGALRGLGVLYFQNIILLEDARVNMFSVRPLRYSSPCVIYQQKLISAK
jgi:hypothetical protein